MGKLKSLENYIIHGNYEIKQIFKKFVPESVILLKPISPLLINLLFVLDENSAGQ